MPIKNIIHKVFGGFVNVQSKVKNIAKSVDQTSKDIARVLSQGFFHTAVNTKSKIAVIGMA